MKLCLDSKGHFENTQWLCPLCGFSPQSAAGFLAFSQDLLQDETGFKQEFFMKLAEIEEKNFWFNARNQLIIWVLRYYFSSANNFLEIGCGTGFVLRGIKKVFPQLIISGSEISISGLVYAAQRIEQAMLFQMDARKIPFVNEYDVIGAFDVLEHIEEDEHVLQQMYQAVKPGGGIIITVPQHKFLWSEQDDYACHVRRYHIADLKNKVMNAGFEIVKTTSFVSLLLPFMLVSRFLKRKKNKNHDFFQELKLPRIMNMIFEKTLTMERLIIYSGIKFPLGGSLLLVAKKT